MAYGLYRKGKGGTLRKLTGDPRGARNQKNIIVWDVTKKGVLDWIRKWGTQTQKMKHLEMKPVTKRRRRKGSVRKYNSGIGGDLWWNPVTHWGR